MFIEIKAKRKENQEHRVKISKLGESNELTKKHLEVIRERMYYMDNKVGLYEREKKRNKI